MSGSLAQDPVFYQSYPPPTELPAMRAGETDGRYMDVSPALAPVGDSIPDISFVTVVVTREDGASLTADDLQQASGSWIPTLDPTGRVVTIGWTAPPTNVGATYILSMSVSQTKEARTFKRDWRMSVLPLMG